MKGNINVQTENIFPVIKKFLYSDHEIFLRELVSNATDATQKLKALVSMGQANVELGDLTIHIKIEDGKLIISDRGIGMSQAEVEKYINQIAFSGAEDFLEKYKNVSENLIGHFGLGFYSAFMVADKVEIRTKSYTDAVAVEWMCDGSPEYTMKEIDKTERGTDIILHISEDSKEFLEENKPFFGLQICISKHFFNSWSFYNIFILFCIIFHCKWFIRCTHFIFREKFLFKYNRLLF